MIILGLLCFAVCSSCSCLGFENVTSFLLVFPLHVWHFTVDQLDTEHAINQAAVFLEDAAKVINDLYLKQFTLQLRPLFRLHCNLQFYSSAISDV